MVMSTLVTVVIAIVIWMAHPAGAVDVVGDDELDRFVGSGAVIMPVSIDAGVRQEAAHCYGCRWKVTMPCQRTGEHTDAACRGFTLGCTQGREIHRAWLARPGQDFEPVGLYCPVDGEVTSVRDLALAVVNAFAHHVPALAPVCQPERGVVVGIPVHCRAGQQREYRWSERLAGYDVTTTARGTWRWTFAPRTPIATSMTSRDPGAPYPLPGTQHTFPIPGLHRVEIQAQWHGEFTVSGLGPLAIDEAVVQDGELLIPTSSALAVIRP